MAQDNPDPEQEIEILDDQEANNEIEDAENVDDSMENGDGEEIFPGYEDESENNPSSDDEEKLLQSFIKKFDGFVVDPLIPATYKTKFPSFFRGFDNGKFY